ncbi:hypothetical protein BOX15_Mlig013005g2, partial [Macrostomum lignano]
QRVPTSPPTPAPASPAISDRNCEDDFLHSEVHPGVYQIRERQFVSSNRANIWLIRGPDSDLLVDTGLGLWDLPAYLRSAGLAPQTPDRPLTAVATHAHFDHAGGLHQFPLTAIHANEAAALTAGDQYVCVTFVPRSELCRPTSCGQPSPSCNCRTVTHLTSAAAAASECCTVRATGSVALERSGLLFSHGVLVGQRHSTWQQRGAVPAQLPAFAGVRVRLVCPGHFDPFGPNELRHLLSAYLARSSRPGYLLGSCISRLIYCAYLKARNSNDGCAACLRYACCCGCVRSCLEGSRA